MVLVPGLILVDFSTATPFYIDSLQKNLISVIFDVIFGKTICFMSFIFSKAKVDIIKDSILDCMALDISRATHLVNFVITLIGVRDLSPSYVIVKCGRNTENADPLTRSI
jgi:hypothetical protein